MPPKIEHIPEQRLQKLNNIRALGIDPYPPRYHRTHTTKQAIELFEQAEKDGKTESAEVNVAGRIMANRTMGKISFIDVHDSTGKIQLFISKNELDEQSLALLKELDIGDIIGGKGVVFRTRSNEPTIRAKTLTMLSKSLQPLPEKFHGLSDVEIRYRQRYLDLISNEDVRKTFETRSKVVSAIRRFMDGRGFLEVETPILEPEANGAAAEPFVTHHNKLDKDMYLRIETELHLKRLIVGGFEKVYEIGRLFRNEGVSFKHNPEFTTMESYEAYADYNSVMEMVEQLVSSVALEVLGTTAVPRGDTIIELKAPWQRLSFRDAITQYSGIDFVQYPTVELLRSKMREKGMEVDPKNNWAQLVDELLSKFVEPKLIQPTFLIDYPVSLSPLAKKKQGQERVVERFEAFAGGFELANAFTELNDPLDQRERFTQQAKDKQALGGNGEIDEDFLLAMEHGMPPTGGLGMGIDRLMMLLTNNSSIREVILFPTMKDKPNEITDKS
ncbi:MAG: lysine--tRNA ligase [Dehalococcoidales bacterium]|nr:lysine--tRNA ligase [Dehalococcoidales bacterium]